MATDPEADLTHLSRQTMNVAAIELSTEVDPIRRTKLEAILSRIDLTLGDEEREIELKRRESKRNLLASIAGKVLQFILLSLMICDLGVTVSRNYKAEPTDVVPDFMVPYAVPTALVASCLAFGFILAAAKRISRSVDEYTRLGDHKPTYYEALRLWESSDITRKIRFVILGSGRQLYVSDYACMLDAAKLMQQIEDPA